MKVPWFVECSRPVCYACYALMSRAFRPFSPTKAFRVTVSFDLVHAVFFGCKSVQDCFWFCRMRSTGFPFHSGARGLRVCSLDVAPPSATVLNQSHEVAMAVPMGSAAKAVTLEVSTLHNLVSCGRRGTSRHPNMLHRAKNRSAEYLCVVFRR